MKIDSLETLYRSARSGSELCDELLKVLRIDLKVTSDDLRKIPASGPVIAVSNHPFGLLDGAVLASLLARVRRDIRVLTNRMLSDLPELASVGIFLDPFERPESRTSNARALKLAV
ncbi:MAG TPA: hypothetical protein VHB50_13955, partial [Bryobacteraceae bacterium]|nr:hypothetical protein [Bryobacteraceae bacterium]